MNPIRVIIELILIVQFTKCSELTVNTSCGMLVGREFESRNGNIVATFNGIPYAKPPLGELRFQDPQPAEPWSGIREAYNFGSVCVQIPYDYPPVNTTKLGNEDCLYLSVYSSDLNPRSLLPVLVYFHGGAFFSGSGEIDKSPEFFMDNDLVMVMVNFRLGVLGFLTMEDDIMPGNLGLKDQNMALVWVQNNIANFGGDPNQVTLIGETTGAACVNFHMYSPMSRGLFHKAITQSGSALDPWATVPPGVARSRAIKMAELFNCPTESSEMILDCLRTKNAYELTESYSEFKEIQNYPVITFEPICDRNAGNPFLPLNLQDAKPAPVPWIVGVTSLAGLVRTGEFVREPAKLTEYDQNFLEINPVSMFYDKIATNPEEISKEIREFYFDDQPITMSLFRNFTDMFTDGTIIWPVIKALQKHNGPQYLYYFDYLGEYSFQEIYAGERVLTGGAYIDDIIYIWNIKNPVEVGVPTTNQDLYISRLLIQLFYNFVSLGEPTPSGFEFDWPQWDSQEQNFISIENSGVTVNSSFLPDRMEFWEQLNLRDNVTGIC